MSRQFWSETLAWATSSGVAVTNTTTETILIPNVTIPANYLQDGRCLRIKAFGAYGTGTGPPTIVFTLRWGGVAGTVFSKTGAITTTVSIGGGASMTAGWEFENIVQTRTNGSAGTVMANGIVTLFTSTVPTGGTVANYGMQAFMASGQTGGTTPVAQAIDMTADTALAFTATWSGASTAHSIQCLNYTIEGMN